MNADTRYEAVRENRHRLFALLALFLLLSSALLSSHHIDHDCTGDDSCPVCALMLIGSAALKALVLCATVFLLVQRQKKERAQNMRVERAYEAKARTLVTQKIKLSS